MKAAIIAFWLTTVAISAPTVRRQGPHYLQTSSSQAFKLVANVTDPALDLVPSINNWLVQGYHAGAGANAEVLTPLAEATSRGPIFYENGTAHDQAYHSTKILTDAGFLPAPFSWQVQPPTGFDTVYPAQHHATIGVGEPTAGYVASVPVVYPTTQNRLGQGAFVAFQNALPTLPGAGTVVTVNYAYATFGALAGLVLNP